MRHKKRFNHLGRKSAHRKAMLANMASSLILHKRIRTTKAKAKALRMYVEPLITKAKHSITTKTEKEKATHLRRVVFSYLKQKEAVTELFREIAPKVEARSGGYTRILKLENRLGDNAEMVYIELVDYNEGMLTASEPKKKEEKKTRRRRSKKSSASAETQAQTPETATQVKEQETPVEEKKETSKKKEEEVKAEEEKKEEPKAKKEPKPKKETKPKAAEAKKEVVADDLKKIEGIDPKIAKTLAAGGLATYAELAKATVDEIKKVLDEAEGNFSAHDPATWSEQAKLAAEGKWGELKKWQDELDGGKVANDKE